MGNLLAEAKITACLSRHNSEKDTRHDLLWLEFMDKVNQLSNNKKYKEILLDVQFNDDMREEEDGHNSHT